LPSPNAGTDEWFNIIIDPWLTGPQADFHKRFSQQWHIVKSCVDNVNDLGVRLDAVIVSHEFTDHCHKATLETIDSKVPVYATTVYTPTTLRYGTEFIGVESCTAYPLVGSLCQSRRYTRATRWTMLDDNVDTTPSSMAWD
jgi:L-ascorbate metabolism protein UlaG (beta-lactamase superfamily)